MSNALIILGGLGVFLFGLRIMSAGLQKLAGARLRAVLAGMTRNRFAGIFSGFLITCAVQSSSATTVLVVSFANAGLLSLAQAAGLVMGANIGTTLTAWLVSLLGFKIKIASFALPIIGIGFPLSLINSRRAKQLSEVLVGFGLLFLGLAFLKTGVPNLKSNPEVFEFVQGLTSYGFGSRVLFVVIGTALTVIVQSSSAASAITLTMVAKGWIQLDLAAAMILGENIGTTITAQLAAIGATRNAKRVANFHTLFNVVGVMWMLPLMSLFLVAIREIIPGDATTNILVATTQVALFHTAFNVTNTALLVGFVGKLRNVVMWMVPLRGDEKGESSHLQFLETGLVKVTELSTVEARRGLEEMAKVCEEMFAKIRPLIEDPEKELGTVADDVRRLEQVTDDMEIEVIEFCTALSQGGMTRDVSREVAYFFELANDIERVGDHCKNLAFQVERRIEKEYTLEGAELDELREMTAAVGEFLAGARKALSTEEYSLGEAKVLEERINKIRSHARKSHAERMQAGKVAVREGILYLDMMTNMEKLGDYCWNVVAITENLMKES